nr:ferritin-like domain-containing protein [Williamsia deligens]
MSTTTITHQLRAVLALTNTEIQVAQTRIAQARTDAVRRELTENAANAKDRATQIEAAIREIGAAPDVIRPLVGRLNALAKVVAEQVAPLDEALLGDLALEHQLLDRSRYLVALATAAGDASVTDLARRLVTAHEATVEWLTTVLAEEAIGGPVALRRGPGQWGAGVALRVAAAPANAAMRGIDKAVELLRRAPDAATAVVEQGQAEADRVRDEIAGQDADDLPIAGYDAKKVSEIVAEIKEFEDPSDIRSVVAYEESHRNRSGVVSAAQTRLAGIAQEIVGIDS